MKDRTHRHLSEKNDIIDIKPEYVPAIPGRRMAKIIRKKDGSYEPNAIDFSLCALRIWDDCAQKKCLKPDTYFFNERLMQSEDGTIALILNRRYQRISSVIISVFKP